MTDLTKRKIRMAVLGPRGSGKHDLTRMIAENCPGFVRINKDETVMKFAYGGSDLGGKLSKYMRKGVPVPDETIAAIMENEISKYAGRCDFVLDDYPNTVAQAESLEKICRLDLVMYLDVKIDEIVENVKTRWVHVRSGRVYNEKTNAPKEEGIDDETGEPLTRDPDNAAITCRDYKAYCAATRPVLEYYNGQAVFALMKCTQFDQIVPQISQWQMNIYKAENPKDYTPGEDSISVDSFDSTSVE